MQNNKTINTMRNILIIIIIIAVSISWSCKKDPKTFTVSGKITKVNSNDEIAGARVYLDSKKIATGVYNANFNNLAFSETNINGDYSFEIEQANTEIYKFRVSKNSYYDIEESTAVETLEASDTFIKNFELTGESWINLKVKNTMPQGTDDEIDYRYVNIEVNGIDCCTNKTTIGIGAEYTEDRLCRTQSDEWIRLEWVVKKNGSQIYHTDSIFATFGQTIIYNINY